MEMSIICICLFIALVLALIEEAIRNILKIKYKHIEELQKQKNKSDEIKKLEIYLNTDLKEVEAAINDYVDKKIEDYIYYHVILNTNNKENFMKKDEIDEMVDIVIGNIVDTISDLYKSYFGLLTNIENEYDLAEAVTYKVRERSLEIVTNFNSSEK